MNLFEAKKIFGNIDYSNKKIIKKRYRQLAKKYHPDNPNNIDDSNFKRLQTAYEIILNNTKIVFKIDDLDLKFMDRINKLNQIRRYEMELALLCSEINELKFDLKYINKSHLSLISVWLHKNNLSTFLFSMIFGSIISFELIFLFTVNFKYTTIPIIVSILAYIYFIKRLRNKMQEPIEKEINILEDKVTRIEYNIHILKQSIKNAS